MPHSKPASPDLHSAPAPDAPPLREIVGGYDIDRLPIHVPRFQDESLEGWLRRLSRRYQVTPRDVLTHLGVAPHPQALPKLEILTAHHPEAFIQAGLEPETLPSRCSPLGAALATLDEDFAVGILGLPRPRWRRAARFCPRCLTMSGKWTDTWHHPYHVVCVRHGLVLETRCPTCGALPFHTPTWMTSTGPIDSCADFTAPKGLRYRCRCATRFATVTPEPADDELLAAQRWLWDILTAFHQGDPVQLIGLWVDPRTAYNAAAEIITQNTAIRKTCPSAPEEQGLRLAHRILSQPSVAAAAQVSLTVEGFDPTDGIAPFAPRSAATKRPRNAVAVAVSLQRQQGHIALGAELEFRIGTAAPCYPPAWNVKTPPLTVTAARPELPLASIPTTLWPGALTLGDADLDTHLNLTTPTGRAFAALALARLGSSRPWRLLALNLALPAHMAPLCARHWRTISNAGHWPAYVHAVADLFDQLHHHPPPIDYERRRFTAQPDLILKEARRATSTHRRAAPPVGTYALALWSTYTQTDTAFAPTELTPSSPNTDRPSPSQVLTQSAARLGMPPAEPLTWEPP